MRTLLIAASISAFGFAGAALAGTPQSAPQCPAPWAEQASLSNASYEAPQSFATHAYASPTHHVMTKAEIRAELDAIKVDRTSGPADRGAPVLLSSRD